MRDGHRVQRLLWGLGTNGQLGNGDIRSSNVPVTVMILAAGELTITVPDTATLDPGTIGGTATGDLGEVTVTDNRPTGAGYWEVTASATPFTHTPPSGTASTIQAGNVTYTIPDNFTDKIPASATPDNRAASGVPLSGSPVVLAADADTGPIRAVTWDPVITVHIPYGVSAGEYQGEIVHSVT